MNEIIKEVFELSDALGLKVVPTSEEINEDNQ